MKFATRAKTIKTSAKLNLKSGQDASKLMLARLKMELIDAKSELEKYRNVTFQIRGEIVKGGNCEDEFFEEDAPNKLQEIS